MAGSFKTPCPSCEADVLVKGSNLIGKKIDCPKCKYRFTVPDPDGSADDGFDIVEKPKKKTNAKALVGIALGVIGIAALVGGGLYFMGDGDKPPVAKTTPSTRPSFPPGDASEGRPKDDKAAKDAAEKEKAAKDKADKDKKVSSPPEIFNPGSDVNPKDKTKTVPVVIPDASPVDPSKMKDPTNLLPNQSEAILKINFDRLRQTPVNDWFFDKPMRDFFQGAMGFEAADLGSAHFCLLDSLRDPFVVVRLKKPVSLLQLQQRWGDTIEPQALINQRLCFLMKSNAFVSALSRVVSAESLRNSAGIPITEEEKKRWDTPKEMGFYLYDNQTLMVGDLNWIKRYLGELQANGEPKHLTEAAGAPVAPAAGGAAGAGEAKDPKGGEGRPVTTTTTAPVAAEDPANPKLIASIPNYLSIKPELKAMFNRLEVNDKNLPSVSYVDRVNQRTFFFEDRDASTTDMIWVYLNLVLPYVDVLGVSVNTVNPEKFTGTILMKYLSENDLKESLKNYIKPIFTTVSYFLSYFFDTDITLVESSGGGGSVGAVAPPPGAGGSGGRRGGAGAPGIPGQPDDAGDVGNFATKSTVTVSSIDLIATIDIDLNISKQAWEKRVQPQAFDLITQMKGRMSVLSDQIKWHSLSTRYAKLFEDKNRPSPTGTLPRDSNPTRFGMPYPPDQRCSFIVELLPYLNRGNLRDQIQEKKYAWYDKRHLPFAQSWVPELLVPYYPQTAWRTYHPLAGNGTVVLGATNFVGLSGVGRDSARFDPKDPAMAKLVGMTGYSWGSKATDVTDGLANTIYMIQVPPNLNRPWIAGGGATILGVDDVGNPMNDFRSTEGGKAGTYALMGDGSVRFLRDTTDPKLFRALVTRAGGEDIGDDVKKLDLVPVPKHIEAELRRGGTSTASGPKKALGNLGKVDDNELKKFQGKWRVTVMNRGGVAMSPTDLAEKNMHIIFEGNKMTLSTSDGDMDSIVKHLDPKTKPCQIGFQTPPDQKNGTITSGVYIFMDTSKLKIRYLKNSTPDKRPGEIKNPGSAADENESYLELEKVE